MRQVAVIDIGKTNKKVLIHAADGHILASRESAFPAIAGGDGVWVEQTKAIEAWLLQQLAELHAAHPFTAIGISTHGATIACLDASDELCLPVIAYDQPLDAATQAQLDADFYAIVGSYPALQAETGTCDLPMLVNPAKAILFYKQRYPQAWQRCRRIVNYPQYWGLRLTGQLAAEPTYTFNHSFLYNLHSRRPSSAAQALGCAGMLPERFARPWDRLGELRAEIRAAHALPALPVTVGVHDSNAALLPYLLSNGSEDFVLNSTGTWCVAMHQVRDARYADDELGLKIIFNVDVLGGLQKTSFLMGGQDYGLYHELIGGDHVGFDLARLRRSLAGLGRMILPGAFPSQFSGLSGGARDAEQVFSLTDLRAGRRPGWWQDRDTAHDLLNVNLALQSMVALSHTGITPTTSIFIEGGFRHNPTYLAVLAALFPQAAVACTDLQQATAVGTALLAQALAVGGEPVAPAAPIERQPVGAPELPELAAYRDAFFAALA